MEVPRKPLDPPAELPVGAELHPGELTKEIKCRILLIVWLIDVK
jgi:hypothetical protein